MESILVILPVESLQKEVNKAIKELENNIGIYVSLNKTQKSIEETLKKEKIKTDKIFFIDCVTNEKVKEDVPHISPSDLEKLTFSIEEFVGDIEGEKYLILDALSTLLIYNNENKVAAFLQKITQLAQKGNLKVIAFSPKTKGEELLNKIFNFFDKVKKI